MNKILIVLICLCCNSSLDAQKIINYLKNNELSSLRKEYDNNDEAVIESLLNFILIEDMGDTVTISSMWYNHQIVNLNPFDEEDNYKYCSLRFKACSWINLLFIKNEENNLISEKDYFVITNKNGQTLFDYHLSLAGNNSLFVKERTDDYLQKTLKKWQKKLAKKGLRFLRSKEKAPFTGYYKQKIFIAS